MPNCDVTALITNSPLYTRANLGGAKGQKAMLAYALAALASVSASDSAYTTQVQTANNIFATSPPDTILAAEIASLFATATRGSLSVASGISGKMAQIDYLMKYDDATLDRLIAYLRCSAWTAFVP